MHINQSYQRLNLLLAAAVSKRNKTSFLHNVLAHVKPDMLNFCTYLEGYTVFNPKSPMSSIYLFALFLF